MRSRSIASTAIIILLASLSGCTDGPDVDGISTPLHGFEAKYTSGGKEYKILFEGPEPIMGRDGRPFNAYKMVTWLPNVYGERPVITRYLDEDLRLVAEAHRCGMVMDCSNNERWIWRDEGDLPPMGLGHLNLIEAGDYTTKNGGRVIPAEWQLEELEDTRIRLDTTNKASLTGEVYDVATFTRPGGSFLIAMG